MRQKEKIAAFFIIAHLTSALLYLSIDKSYKYDPRYEDYFSLWFFGGEYAFISAITYLKPTCIWHDIFLSHLATRAILYTGYFSDLYSDNIIMRLGFMTIILFVISIRNVKRSYC